MKNKIFAVIFTILLLVCLAGAISGNFTVVSTEAESLKDPMWFIILWTIGAFICLVGAVVNTLLYFEKK